MPQEMPAAARPFVAFARSLRDQGMPVVSDQTVAFLRAIGVLGPRSIRDVYWAACATLAPPIDRMADFDALFESSFGDGGGLGTVAESIPEDDAPSRESSSGMLEPLEAGQPNESGEAATTAEALSLRSFVRAADDARLAAMRRALPAMAPRRRGFRRVAARRGDRLDLRRSLRGWALAGTGIPNPACTRRREKTRRILLLIDISGSMKAGTEDALRFAHALTQSLAAVETFSFGTRLTRLTRSLQHKDLGRALAEISPAVADWDGGTRIGDSLVRFLSIPRFSRASRGALVIVLSDGLERGDPRQMAAAVRRLAARSWRLAWLTPLAADPDFSPDTAALRAILPIVDHLGDGSSLDALCSFVENSGRLGAALPAVGRMGVKRHASADHRRAPPHLASARPALAGRTNAAAHLRPI